MMKLAFVVLHYKNAEVTMQCIELLLRQDAGDFVVIVLDNGSGNDSYEALEKQYAAEEKICLIRLERNYGFAKANNVGYLIAKHKYDAEAIIVMNNDVMIADAQFCNKLEALCGTVPFDILGPDILTLRGERQNPLANCIETRRQLSKAIFMTRVRLMLIPMLYRLVRRGESVRDAGAADGQAPQMQCGVPLHGSCLIYGKTYIDKHETAFYPDTFLYGEEDILFYLAKREQLRLVFHPAIEVLHMEDVSTDGLVRDRKAKRLFQLRHSLRSLLILNELMAD